MVKVPNTKPDQVFSFVRRNEHDKVFAVFNFSAEPQNVSFQDGLFHGKYIDYMSGQEVGITASLQLVLKPWEYRIFVM